MFFLIRVTTQLTFFLSFFQFSLEKVDITLKENSGWYKKYCFDIPVFHFNGSFLMKHRVDHEKLQKELSKWEQSDS